jgi:CBS-domain-containing membrane protein
MKSCVRDVMATRVVAVRKNASFKEMIVQMRKSMVSALPVVDDGGRVIGVVSQADMLDKEADLATGHGPLASALRFGDHEKAAGVTAAELMTCPPVTAGPDTPLAEAARLMRDHRVKRLPVTNAGGRLIGVVSRGDVLSVFTRPDADIQREAAEEMIAESFVADSRGLGVTVHDGIVTLTGHPETPQAGRDLAEAVRHIDGVIAIRDQLSYAGTPR